MSTTKQYIVAVSLSAKTFIKGATQTFSAPSKSKEVLFASEREVVDGLIEFAQESCKTDEGFNGFTDAMKRVMARRMSNTAELSKLQDEITQLKADKAALSARLAKYKALSKE